MDSANQPVKTSALAKQSLALGIASIALCLGFICGIPAIICGVKARSKIRRSNGTLGGDGLAIAGLVTGCFGTVFITCFICMQVIGTLKFIHFKRIEKTECDIAAIALGIDSYKMLKGGYPSNLEILAQGNDPYFKKGIPLDPWGHPYQYKYPGTHPPLKYDVSSLGPDGVESADDITSWKAESGSRDGS